MNELKSWLVTPAIAVTVQLPAGVIGWVDWMTSVNASCSVTADIPSGPPLVVMVPVIERLPVWLTGLLNTRRAVLPLLCVMLANVFWALKGPRSA